MTADSSEQNARLPVLFCVIGYATTWYFTIDPFSPAVQPDSSNTYPFFCPVASLLSINSERSESEQVNPALWVAE